MSDNIVVALRVRPLIAREISDANTLTYWEADHPTIVQIDPESKKNVNTFTFDQVFGAESKNQDIYDSLASQIVEASLTGINGTIFAYGQTSSGKTYTMCGTEEDPGVIPLLIKSTFHLIENMPDREFLLRASYMEIYKEQVFDLLTGARINSLREDSTGQVLVPGIKEICVTNEKMLHSVMKNGDKRRKVGETQMNERSSRSHSIFRLIVESRERDDRDCEGGVTVSHLNLVDLAGSENATQTGAQGERLKEGGAINKSLFMLGRVISQLSDGEQFINFRDSKLTRILQNSLGGNAKTAIICNVTPVSKDQTLSTVRFALRAKSIQNKPIVNEVLSESALLKRYATEIKKLKVALENERKTDKAQEVEQVKEKLDEQEKRNQDLQAKILSLKEKLVVSSHSATQKSVKEKKSRRETWSAPTVRRPSGMSLAPQSYDSRFLLPPLNVLTFKQPLAKISEESIDTPETNLTPSFNDTGSSFDSSVTTREERFDKDEMSKIFSFDGDFISPRKLPRSARRRKKDLVLVDGECQTEDSLLLTLLNTNFKTPTKKTRVLIGRSPFSTSPIGGETPKDVLRSMNVHLNDVLTSKETVLKDWQEELRSLEELHKNELKLLREEFEERMETGFFDEKELDGEIRSLKKSLEDANRIYLDANKTVSEQCDRIQEMEGKLAHFEEENGRLSKAAAEKDRLNEELELVKKDLREKNERNQILEKDKEDFAFKMELALEKQKQTETYLRKSLNEAWEEIAKYERMAGSNSSTEKSTKDLELLASSLAEERRSKTDLEETVSKLQTELLQTQEELDKERESNCVSETQFGMEKTDGKSSEVFKVPKRFSHDSTEWDCESENTYSEPSPLEITSFSNITANPFEVSRKLCETLHLLDESLSGGITSHHSVNLSEVMLIREQLVNLQEMLLFQESSQQNCFSSNSHRKQNVDDVSLRIQDHYDRERDVFLFLEDVSRDFFTYSSEECLSRRQQVKGPLSPIPPTTETFIKSTLDEHAFDTEVSLCPSVYSPMRIENDDRSCKNNIMSLADELRLATMNETDLEVDEREEGIREAAISHTFGSKIVEEQCSPRSTAPQENSTPLPEGLITEQILEREVIRKEEITSKIDCDISNSWAEETNIKFKQEKMFKKTHKQEHFEEREKQMMVSFESEESKVIKTEEQIVALEEKVRSQEDEIKSLKRQLEEQRGREGELNALTADLTREKERFEERERRLMVSLESEGSKVIKTEKQIVALEEKVRSQEDEIKSLKGELEEQRSREKESNALTADLTRKEEHFEERERQLMVSLESEESKVIKTEEQIVAFEEKVRNQKDEIKSLKKQLEEQQGREKELNVLTTEFTQKEEHYKERARQMMVSLESEESKVIKTEEQIVALEEKVRSQEDEIKSLKGELEEQRSREKESNALTADLTREKERFEERERRLMVSLESEESKVIKTEEQIVALEEKVRSQEDEIKSLKGELEEQRSREKESNALTADLTRKEEHFEERERQLMVSLESEESKVIKTEEQIVALEEKVRSQEDEIKSLKGELDEQRSRKKESNALTADLTREKERFEERERRLMVSLESEESKVIKTEEQIVALEEKVRSQEDAIKSLKGELEEQRSREKESNALTADLTRKEEHFEERERQPMVSLESEESKVIKTEEQIVAFEEKVRSQEDEIKSLKEELEEQRSREKESNALTADLTREKERFEERERQLMVSFESEESKVIKTEKQIVALEEKVRSQEDEIKSLKGELEEQRSREKESNALTADLTREKERFEERERRLMVSLESEESKVIKTEEQIVALEEKVRSQEDAIKSLKGQLEEQRRREKELNALNADLTRKEEHFEERERQLMVSLESEESKVIKTEEQIVALEEKVRSQEDEIKSLKGELEGQRSREKESNALTADLTREKERFEERERRLMVSLESEESKVIKTEEQIVALEEKVRSQEDAIKSLKGQLEEQRRREKELNALTADLTRKEENFEERERQLMVSLESEESKVIKTEEQIVALEEKVRSQEDAIKSLKGELEEQRRREKELNALTADLTRKEEHFEERERQLMVSLESEESKVIKTEEQIVALEEKVRRQEDEIKSLKGELEEQRRREKELNALTADLTRKEEHFEERERQLMVSLESEESKVIKTEEQIVALEEKVRSQEDEIKSLKGELDEQRSRKKESNALTADLTREKERFEERERRLMVSLESEESKVIKTEEQIVALEEKVRSQEDAIKSLKGELEEQRSREKESNALTADLTRKEEHFEERERQPMVSLESEESKVIKTEEQIVAFEEKVRSQEDEIKSLKEELEEQRSREKESNALTADLTREKERFEERERQLMVSFESEESKVIKTEKQIVALEEKVRSQEDEIKSLKGELEEQRSREKESNALTADLTREKERFEERERRLMVSLESEESKVIKTEEQIVALEEKVRSQEDAIKSLKGQLEEQRRREKELNALNADLTRKEEHFEERERQLMVSLESEESKVIKTEEQIVALEEKVRSQEDEIKSLKGELEGQRSREKESNALTADLTREKERFEERERRLMVSLESEESKVIKTEEQIVALEEKVRSQEDAIKSLKGQLEEQRRREKELNALTADLTRKEENFEERERQLMVSLESEESKVIKTEEQIVALEEKVRSQEDAIKSLKGELEEQRRREKELNALTADLTRKEEHFEERERQLMVSLESEESKVIKTEEQIVALEEKVRRQEDEIKSLKGELEEQRRREKELNALTADLTRKEEHFEERERRLMVSLESEESKVIKTEEQIVALKEKVRNQEDEIKSLKKQLEEQGGREKELNALTTEFVRKEKHLEKSARRLINPVVAIQSESSKTIKAEEQFVALEEKVRSQEGEIQSLKEQLEQQRGREEELNALTTEFELTGKEEHLAESARRLINPVLPIQSESSKVIKAEEQIVALEEKVRNQEDEIKSLKKQLEKQRGREEELNALTTELKGKEKQSEEREGRLKQREDVADSEEECRASVCKLKDDLARAEDSLFSLNLEKEELVKGHQKLEEELREKNQSYDSLSDEYDQAIVVYQTQIDGLKQSIGDYMSKVKSLQKENYYLSKIKDSKLQVLNSTTIEPTQDEEQLEGRERRLEHRDNVADREEQFRASICKLKEDLSHAEDSLFRLNLEKEELKKIHQKTEEELRERSQSYDSLSDEYDQAIVVFQTQIDGLKQSIREYISKVKSLQQENDQLSKMEASKNNSTLDTSLSCNVTNQNNFIEALKEEVASLRRENCFLKTDLKKLKEEYSEIKILLKQLEKLHGREEELNALAKELTCKGKQLEERERRLNQNENIVDREEEFRASVCKLKEDLARAEDSLSKLNLEKEELEKRHQKMEEELREKTQSYDSLSDEYDQAIVVFQTQIDGLKQSVREYMSKVKSLQEEIDHLKKIKESENNNHDTTLSPNITNERSMYLDTPKDEVASLRTENWFLKDEVQKLREENNVTVDELNQTKARLCSTSSLRKSQSTSFTSYSRKSKQMLIEEIEKLRLEICHLKDEVDGLRSNKGIIGSTEELEKQLEWMRKEQQKTELLNERLNQNYDLLEEEKAELERKISDATDRLAYYERNYRSKKQSFGSAPTAGVKAEDGPFFEEKEIQTEPQKSDICGSLRKEYFELKRENNILKLKLDALNAPAKKEVIRLKEELDMMQSKNKKLLDDMRRLQNSNVNDLSTMERNPHSASDEPNNDLEDRDIGSGFGSKVVLDVVVMRQKKVICHLEKEISKLKRELDTLTKNVKYYKLKSDEWKTKCYNESHRAKEAEDRLKNAPIKTQEKAEVQVSLHSKTTSPAKSFAIPAVPDKVLKNLSSNNDPPETAVKSSPTDVFLAKYGNRDLQTNSAMTSLRKTVQKENRVFSFQED